MKSAHAANISFCEESVPGAMRRLARGWTCNEGGETLTYHPVLLLRPLVLHCVSFCFLENTATEFDVLASHMAVEERSKAMAEMTM